jgi:hypothetical protein
MRNSKIKIKDQALVYCEAFLLIIKERRPIISPIVLLNLTCLLVSAPHNTPVRIEYMRFKIWSVLDF